MVLDMDIRGSLGVDGGSWLDSELFDLNVDAAEWLRPWEISGRVARRVLADAGPASGKRPTGRTFPGSLSASATVSEVSAPSWTATSVVVADKIKVRARHKLLAET